MSLNRKELSEKLDIPEEEIKCESCLNSEPYVCDIIYCTEFKMPTPRHSYCGLFKKEV